MKKLSMILMAGLLVLGLSQCKKENTNNNNEETEGVKITLTVDNGGQKVNVTPGQDYSEVAYTDGDVILVANDGHYVGYLTYNASAFSGTITQSLTQGALHFIFVGNKVAPDGLIGGTTDEITVDMSDQSNGPAVISYASVNYEGGDSVNATVTLLNQASGLVMFTTGFGLTNPITISGSGMYNAMTISFANTPTFTPANTTSNPNEIKLYQTSDAAHKTFLAVIPQNTNAVENVNVITRGFSGTITVPAVYQNMNYYNEGEGVKMTLTQSAGPFTVNNQGTKVYFAPGNLQAVGTTTSSPNGGWTWQFATNQWNYIGASPANTRINGNGTISANGTVDLFGWSTDATTNYYGINNSTTIADYSGTFVDWAVEANAAILGGHNDWYTMSYNEWEYMVNHHTQKGWTSIIVDNKTIRGYMILPDDAMETIQTSYNYTTDNLPLGALFLPAAGTRSGTNVQRVNQSNDLFARVWSSTPYRTYGQEAWAVPFDGSGMTDGTINNVNRSSGSSVRLARVVSQ